MNHIIGAETLEALSQLDTCSIANAVETFGLRLRNEGYSNSSLHCHFPLRPPMVGYAITLRIRTASPPAQGNSYLDRTDWWKRIEPMLLPHVLVIQDMDEKPGRAAFVGEVHAAILKALGCTGVVTNGAVRDLDAVEKLGVALFSGSLSVSHGYSHVVEYGTPVEVAGLRIKPGDLLHGDRHGVVLVPQEAAESIPKIAASMRRREKLITAYCRLREFSAPGLERLIRETAT